MTEVREDPVFKLVVHELNTQSTEPTLRQIEDRLAHAEVDVPDTTDDDFNDSDSDDGDDVFNDADDFSLHSANHRDFVLVSYDSDDELSNPTLCQR